jgi:hypothetical protein
MKVRHPALACRRGTCQATGFVLAESGCGPDHAGVDVRQLIDRQIAEELQGRVRRATAQRLHAWPPYFHPELGAEIVGYLPSVDAIVRLKLLDKDLSHLRIVACHKLAIFIQNVQRTVVQHAAWLVAQYVVHVVPQLNQLERFLSLGVKLLFRGVRHCFLHCMSILPYIAPKVNSLPAHSALPDRMRRSPIALKVAL